jgi:hypothetical protein
MSAFGTVGFGGDLATRVIRPRAPHKAVGFKLPGGRGRILFSRDPGDAGIFAREVFASELFAIHRDGDGRVIHEHDLGSGLVTNVGVTALANDFAWAQNCQTLKLANQHATGTGTTAAAATDIALQTLAAPTTTTAVAGTQSLVSAANSQTYRTVATINYTSTLAITEWGLHTAAALSATTGTPFTATTATSATVTGTPYSASSSSVQGEQQLIVKPGTTTVYGLILANTTSVLTIPAWYKVADGTAGSTPGSTEAFTLLPVLWDHKVFSAINVANGDSIQFTYNLAVNSGG